MEKEDRQGLEDKNNKNGNEERKMDVAKGIMTTVPQESSEKFLSYFEKSNVDIAKLKELSTIHKGKKDK